MREVSRAAAVKFITAPVNAIRQATMLLATTALGFTARRALTVPRTPAAGQLRMMSDAAKKGYWVGNFTPLPDADMDEFASGYRAPMIESLGPFGGKLLMVAPKPATVYYAGDAGAVNWIAEFPSVQAAQDWHESDAYKAIIPCRDKHITASYVIAEGM